jgi:hypothetical protein
MARGILLISLVGIIGSALLLGLNDSALPTLHAQSNMLDGETEQRILRATVQITMVGEEVQDTVIRSTSESYVQVSQTWHLMRAEGIGTLVSLGGEVVLVTHNHWPQMVDATKPDRVRFHDAQGELLLEIDGADFYYNTLYRDNGTLVMRTPDELLDKLEPIGEVGDSQGIAPNDTVHIVRHQPGSEMRIGSLEARVRAVDQDGLHTKMTLQSVNGQSIEPGDSGGGIWFNDTLVGNMWMTIREEWSHPDDPGTTTMMVTDRSVAAGLTMNLLGESLMTPKKCTQCETSSGLSSASILTDK